MSRRSSRYYSARTPKMPIGLIGLMEELSRDVLRNNPTELYSFCAEHMKKLLIIRDATKSKKDLTLEQKIALARTKVKERAAQRCENFDKKMREIKTESTREVHFNNAEQQVQEINVVIKQQNELEKKIEAEIADNEKKYKEKSDTLIEKITSTEIDSSQLTDAIQCKNKDEGLIEGEERKTISAEKEEIKDVQYLVGITEQDANKIDRKKNKVAQDCEPICNEEFNTNVDDSKINVPDSEVLGRTEEDENLKENDDLKHLDSTKIESNINEPTIENNNTETSSVTIHDNKKDNLQVPNRESDLKRIKENELCTTTDVTVIENTKKDIEVASLSLELEPPKEENNDETQKKSRKLPNHVNNNSMDLETAAITIQKVFRSFLFRNKTQSIDDATNVDINLLMEEKENKFQDDRSPLNVNVNKDRRTLGVNRMDTTLQTVNEEKSLSLSTDDSSTLSSAATIIQAHVRGFLVRNKFNNNKTTSCTSGIDSDGQSFTSLEGDNDNRKNKTVLNIHIVPESGHFISRDESMLTSIDLSLDNSPPNSSNLHPLGYDKTERRKQLKREDAIQSISPPSNNSGKLSEDVDSVKEIVINTDQCAYKPNDNKISFDKNISPVNTLNDENVSTVINSVEADAEKKDSFDDSMNLKRLGILSEITSDEIDVITPNVCLENNTPDVSDVKLLHSGECHDVVLPTKVSRNDTSVVREFQNVVVYFLLWNNS